jgi:hypothetical protein
MAPSLWTLPGPLRWIRDIEAERSEARSVVLLCPSSERPVDLIAALDSGRQRGVNAVKLSRADWWVSASGSTSPARLLSGLIDEFRLTCPPEPYGFCSAPEIGRQEFVVDVRDEDCAVQVAWIQLASEVASAGGAVLPNSRPSLLVVSSPTREVVDRLPPADLNLKYYWWWGVLRDVDAVVHAEAIGLDPELIGCAVELVRWDVDMLERLRGWDGLPESLSRLHLGDLPTGVVPRLPGARHPERPPNSLLAEWSAGAVEFWSGGPATHTGLHLDSVEELSRRVWAGQVARVLPFVEFERVKQAEFIAALLERAGGVSQQWERDNGPDVAALEIGSLVACVHAHGVRVPNDRWQLIHGLRDLRNDIAHLRPVKPSRIRALRTQAGALHGRTV